MEWSSGRLAVHVNEWGEFVFRLNGERCLLESDEAVALARAILITRGEHDRDCTCNDCAE